MEAVVKQWEEEEEEEAVAEEVEEVSLVRRQAHGQVTTFTISTTSNIDIQGQEISETKQHTNGIEEKNITSPSSDPIIHWVLTPLDTVTIESEQRQEISETKYYFSDIEKNITSPFSDPIIPGDSTPLKNVTIESGKREEISETRDNASSSDIEKKKNITSPFSGPVISWDLTTESERVGVITENIRLAQELYLESLYQKTPTQGFYCPSCRACIQKVLILDKVRPEPVPPPQPPPPFERFRCTTCYSFVVPIGSWLCPWWVREKEEITEDAPETEITEDAPETKVPPPEQVPPDSRGRVLQPEPTIPDDTPKIQDHQVIEIPDAAKVPDGSIAIPKTPQEDISKVPEQKKPEEEVVHDEGSTEPIGGTILAPPTPARAVQEPESSKTWDILKSIVYGGLIESIASLGIVASSASADAATLSILALSLANLIGGLFVLVHHIWDLKSEQQGTNELVDRYYLSLGKRDNFYLHLCIAILSFIIFGLVPPLVYGLTIYETSNKVLTLVAVAGASVICISLLAIAKTYIQRPNTYLTYLKTVLYYLCTGALTSVIAYLAGVLIRELLERLGLGSESSSLGFELMLPEMSMIEKPRFGSY